VPFNFDVHALHFSKDAVGIEKAMHERLADRRVNVVNQRREFFRASPLEVKGLLGALAGELLHFQEVPDAIEYRQCLHAQARATPSLAAAR
jgi:Meiotically up-regulated gene 113